MRDSFSLGRIFGVRVGINWSVLLILAFLMWTLATSLFPTYNPGLGDGTYFAMAVAASLGFFGSILLHELGHAVQARRDGMEIDGITLWLFGGVARFRSMFGSAGVEFRIAVAGPLVSLVLGAGFMGVTRVPGLPEPIDGVCSWLGFTNLLLLAFNLLPALPLDGGRMLRAALWHWRGDLRSATRLAAGTGRIVALGIIGVGIALFALGDQFGGLWLAVIGWFVLQAAGAEGRMVSEAPRVVRVGDMVLRDPVTADRDQRLDRFVEDTVWDHRHPVYPVVEDGRTVGLFELRRLAEVARPGWAETRVGDLMTPLDRVPVLSEGEDLSSALDRLRAAGTTRGLVLDGDRLVGLLSLSDVARALEAGRVVPV